MDITELKTLWNEHGFRPQKSLGQNFLIDKNIRDNILNTIPFDKNRTVLEIGPGFGVMSFEAAKRCKKLFVVEKDDRVCDIMTPLFEKAGNITLIRGDILETDIASLVEKDEKIIVIGNIPYSISTPIMEMIIDNRKLIDSAHLVIQEELADRIVSAPGSKVYGSISCFIQYFSEAKKILKIGKNVFLPRPEVDSCLLRLNVLSEPSVKVKDEALMFKIIRRAFGQRRKQILNPLASSGIAPIDKSGWQKVLESCGIDPAKRAEDLFLSDYAKLADAIANMRD